MSSEIPLLAVVVPTRNHREYVTSAIKSLLRIPAAEIEVVVEDNSDTNELQGWSSRRPRMAGSPTTTSSEPTSQTGNFNRSLRGVTAEYVAFIGDDDGVNPEIVEAAAWAKANGLDALTRPAWSIIIGPTCT